MVTPNAAESGKPVDLIVLFSGAPSTTVQGTPDADSVNDLSNTFNTGAYRQTHQALVPICFFGGRKTTDRSAVAVAQALLWRLQNPAGVTAVLGVSLGAYAALATAAELTKKAIKLDYVAINDGAFFKEYGQFSITGGPNQVRTCVR